MVGCGRNRPHSRPERRSGAVNSHGCATSSQGQQTTVAIRCATHNNPGPIIGNIISPIVGRANQMAGNVNGKAFGRMPTAVAWNCRPLYVLILRPDSYPSVRTGYLW